MKANNTNFNETLFFCILLVNFPFLLFSQEDFLLPFSKVPSLEDISIEMGNPITVIAWRSILGNMRFKRAVLCGNYERRFRVANTKVIFEDRAEFKGDWQDWYITGEKELEKDETIETVLSIFLDYDLGLTIYQENIDKTMVIKFSKRSDTAGGDDGYFYIYGVWYFIEGKL
jgi:hypothetical protein